MPWPARQFRERGAEARALGAETARAVLDLRVAGQMSSCDVFFGKEEVFVAFRQFGTDTASEPATAIQFFIVDAKVQLHDAAPAQKPHRNCPTFSVRSCAIWGAKPWRSGRALLS